MQLFVMRHGQAEMFSASDAERPLTETGKLEAQVMGTWLNKEHVEIERIFVSPYTRAQQTCEQVMELLACCPERNTVSMITPSGSAAEFHDYLDGICASEKISSLLIVSHMPLVSYLVEELTVERNAPIFQTAGIAQIDYDLKRMKGHLVQMISPSDLV